MLSNYQHETIPSILIPEEQILNDSLDNNLKQAKNSKTIPNDRLQSIQCYFLSIYFILTLSSIIFFSLNKSVRSYLIDFFSNIDDNLDFRKILFLFFLILFLIVVGFPTMPWELALSYFFKNYFLAYLFNMTCKLSGYIFIFFIAKLFLKKSIDNLLKDNKFFRIVKLGAKTHPFKMVFLIKVMMIPHLIKNYGLGITDISFIQYFIPSLIVAAIYGIIWIYLGRQLTSLTRVFDDKAGPKNEITIIKIVLMVITSVSFVIILCYAKIMYKNLANEIEKEDLYNEQTEVKNYGTFLAEGE